jgi:hypothetical protein
MKNSKRVILYQKYKDASEKISDPFWKEIFVKLSYGKVPGSFIVNDNILSFRRRKKIIDTLSIPSELDEESINQVIDFIRKYSGIRSKIDLEGEEKFVQENKAKSTRISEMPWKSLKKNKKLLNVLIFNFMIREVRIRNLNYKEKLELARIIKLGMTIDIFKGFIFNESEEIIGIEGLEYDEHRRTYRLSDIKSVNSIVEPENSAESTAENTTENITENIEAVSATDSKEDESKETDSAAKNSEEIDDDTEEFREEVGSIRAESESESKENESSESVNLFLAGLTRRRRTKKLN